VRSDKSAKNLSQDDQPHFRDLASVGFFKVDNSDVHDSVDSRYYKTTRDKVDVIVS
jgi:hypothetical protein